MARPRRSAARAGKVEWYKGPDQEKGIDSRMALSRFGFIVTGAGLDPARHRVVMSSGTFEMIAVGVSRPEHGVDVACGPPVTRKAVRPSDFGPKHRGMEG